MSAPNVQLIARAIPAALKTELAATADERGSNLNDVAVGILAERLGVTFAPTGRRSSEIGNARDLVLRMPETLRRKIKARAATAGISARDLVIRELCAHYGLRTAAPAAA